MDKLFRQAILNPLIQKPAAIIYALWQNLECPVPPGGPNTEIAINISWCGPDADGVTDRMSQQYDDSIIQLFELCGVYFVDRDCWVTKKRNGNEQWEEFSDKSRKIALNYVANELWNVFCSR